MSPVPSRVFSGERFKQLRKEAGIKGSDIHRATGIAQWTLSSWATGRNVPQLNLLILVADVLGCSLDDLLVPNEEASDGDLI
ncbi:helix-turn-helix domain-containing protein [Streptomyces sp. NPDC056707]|uniref:helix-turn-helix domain-containing protein n=1 Tax=Streptomyces sp. NPDC056707 TaxID=3345919 RepID=UPI0036BC722B